MNIMLSNGELVTCPECGKPMEVVRTDESNTMAQLECVKCEMYKFIALLGTTQEKEMMEDG